MRLSLFFLLWICALPASADTYLMYESGKDRSAHIWNGPEPIPGEHCPADWTVVKWDVDKNSGDTEPRNYKLSGKDIVYDKPPPPDPLPPRPDPNKFEQAIRDGIANDTISANAVSFTGQLAKERDDTKRQQIWSKIKASGLLWLNPANVSAIETAASDARMPLK